VASEARHRFGLGGLRGVWTSPRVRKRRRRFALPPHSILAGHTKRLPPAGFGCDELFALCLCAAIVQFARTLRTIFSLRSLRLNCLPEPLYGFPKQSRRPSATPSRSPARRSLGAANSETGAEYRSLSADDFTALYRAGRLGIRLYHSRTAFSRLQVIAPNPATARGWTGTVLRDEAAFTPAALESQLQEAVGPIIDADPSFRLVYASNLPLDDRHPFFAMTLPPPGLEFPSNPAGHLYRGQNGILIHRVALPDACAAGHTLYDPNTAAPLTLEQFYAQAVSRGALRRNYLLIHEFGGAAAIDLLALDAAQHRGLGQSALFSADTDADFDLALAFLR